MKKILLTILGVIVAFWAGAGVVKAALTFGNGTYTNLCGSGTAATVYSCDQGCNPATGSCQGSNQGVVRWTCSGRWIQCLEAESEWANSQQIGSVACGKTVQISKFDKKCRLEDGSWDSSCQLLGYMVWYSGDCGISGGITPTPVQSQTTPTSTPRPSPTVRPSATPRLSATPQPTQGSATPTSTSKFNTTPSPTPRRSTPTPTAVAVCNKKCNVGDDCGAGFACEAGVCRNPACPADNTCFCGQVKGATGSGTTPETGAEDWLLVAGVGLAIVGGVMMRRAAARIW